MTEIPKCNVSSASGVNKVSELGRILITCDGKGKKAKAKALNEYVRLRMHDLQCPQCKTHDEIACRNIIQYHEQRMKNETLQDENTALKKKMAAVALRLEGELSVLNGGTTQTNKKKH